jgi:hypothetical protein
MLPSRSALKRQLKGLKARESYVRRVRQSMAGTAASRSDEPLFSNADPEHAPLRASALPKNPELEKALTAYHASRRDPRARLDLLRSLYPSVLLSIASPVGAWDALNLKPQPFALGRYMALPVFTSLPHLQSFCRQFKHEVRGPDGAVWGSPTLDTYSSLQLTKRRKKKAAAQQTPRERLAAEEREEEKTRLEAAAKVKRFRIEAATPLPVWGALERPYLYGYFGDAETVLRNTRSAKTTADIVLNPATPLELVLGYKTTKYLLNQDDIMQRTMRDVHLVVRHELAAFFARTCPEVRSARSALLPRLEAPGTANHAMEHDMVIVVNSRDFGTTMERLSLAKTRGEVQGHESMTLVSSLSAPDHVDAACTTFYDASVSREAADVSARGGYEQVGKSLIVESKRDRGGALADFDTLTLAPHEVFTYVRNLERRLKDG